jgi:hypothetical protein
MHFTPGKHPRPAQMKLASDCRSLAAQGKHAQHRCQLHEPICFFPHSLRKSSQQLCSEQLMINSLETPSQMSCNQTSNSLAIPFVAHDVCALTFNALTTHLHAIALVMQLRHTLIHALQCKH